MKKEFLELGKIVNTHGIRGEMKVMHMCDSPEFLCEFKTVYLDENTSLKVVKSRIHKNAVLMTFEGINDINEAEKFKNRLIYMDRADAPDDLIFQQDIIGFKVFDEFLDREIGTLKEILPFPTYDMLVIKGLKKEYMIPDVEQFVLEIDEEQKMIFVKTIEGLIDDEN